MSLFIYHLAYLICFAYEQGSYENLLDQYEILTRTFTGWTLADIKGLSVRERSNWIERSQRKARR